MHSEAAFSLLPVIVIQLSCKALAFRPTYVGRRKFAECRAEALKMEVDLGQPASGPHTKHGRCMQTGSG